MESNFSFNNQCLLKESYSFTTSVQLLSYCNSALEYEQHDFYRRPKYLLSGSFTEKSLPTLNLEKFLVQALYTTDVLRTSGEGQEQINCLNSKPLNQQVFHSNGDSYTPFVLLLGSALHQSKDLTMTLGSNEELNFKSPILASSMSQVLFWVSSLYDL